MIFDKNIFIINIEKLIADKHGGYAAPFNRNIGQRDAVTRWKTGKFKPSLDVLLKITQLYEVSLDWLLTGENPNISDTMSTWPEDVRDACLKAKEIIESKDPVVTPVLMSNIAAFYDAIKQKEDNRVLAKKVDDLQKEVEYIKKISKPGSRTGTD